MERPRELLIDGVHLFALGNVVVAQPLYDLLSRNLELFIARRSESIDVWLLMAGLSVLIPLGLVLIVGIAEALAARGESQSHARTSNFSPDQGAKPQSYWSIPRISQHRDGGKGPFAARLDFCHGLLGPRIGRSVQCCLIGALVALGTLPALKSFESLADPILVLLAGGIGTAASVLYARFKPLRSSFSLIVLVLAGLVFPASFLFNSPVLGALTPEERTEFGSPDFDAETPVVMVIFDELPVTSLMDEQGLIDPIRYPNLAALAKDAHWYRAATTRTADTLRSVPAILSGLAPGRVRPHATAESYPRTLFTLLGGAYHLKVFESITQLCPEELCRGIPRQDLQERLAGLFEDLAIVYLHMVGPKALTSRLPAVTQNWRSFAEDEVPIDPDSVVFEDAPKHEKFRIFVDSIRSTDKPALYFTHMVLPHVPWKYLPSGKRYSRGDVPGLNLKREVWTEDDWLVLQGYQRHLLQLGFVDLMVGDLLVKLRVEGIYDRSLIVVTADHGVNFTAGRARRGVLKEFPNEIKGVPLLIKEPYQEGGVIHDTDVETIDILPTMTDILEIPMPWSIDGSSFYQTQRGGSSRFDPRTYAPLQRKLEVFGDGSTPGGLFKFGPYRDLVGRDIGGVDVVGEAAASVVVDQAGALARVSLKSEVIPSQMIGRISGATEEDSEFHLAIATQGTIEAVTRTYREDGKLLFRAIIPEKALRAGLNIVEVFLVSEGSSGVVLERLGGQQKVTYALHSTLEVEPDSGSDAGLSELPILIRSDGRRIQGVEGGVEGSVRSSVREGSNQLRFSGWAFDRENGELVESIVMFSGRRFVRAGRTGAKRPGLVKKFGNRKLLSAGFRWDLPQSWLAPAGTPQVRFFAISRSGVATELAYIPGT